MKKVARILLAVVVSCITTGAFGETPDSRKQEELLAVGVTGSTPSEQKKNPAAILQSPDVQKMILEISDQPMSRKKIEAVIEEEFFTLDDMVNIGLLREENGLFYIDFNLLRVSDQKKILETSERLGRDIARAFLKRRGELEAIASAHDQPHVGDRELFYVLIGCFSLDWDGLEVTEEKGYRAGAQRTIDGHSFTPWAKEKGFKVSLRGLYWGSHSSETSDTTFTTFGDHDALPRLGLPDMIWQMRGSFEPYEDYADARKAASRVLAAYADYIVEDIARVMMVLRDRDLSFDELEAATMIDEDKLHLLLAFLEASDYIGMFGERYGSRVLVLGPEDAEIVRGLLKIGREIMVEWHESNYGEVKEELKDLTPVRNGVPFERVYTEIWHFVFGIANRALVEEELFADPYAQARQYKGFIPAVWSRGLSETP